MTRKLLGQIGVDTGTLFLIDPGYLTDAARWKPKKLLELAKEHEVKGEDNMAQNCLRLAKEKAELQFLEFDWQKFCQVLKDKPKLAAGGIILPTHHDGGFNVYEVKNKDGEVTKYEVMV